MYTLRIVIPRRSSDENTVAIIDCDLDETAQKCGLAHPDSFKALLTKVVTTIILDDWKGYKHVWLYAGNDFNIGDLASSFSENDIRSKMSQYGVHNFRISTFCDDQTPDNWNYDTPLVDAALIEEKHPELY